MIQISKKQIENVSGGDCNCICITKDIGFFDVDCSFKFLAKRGQLEKLGPKTNAEKCEIGCSLLTTRLSEIGVTNKVFFMESCL